MSRLDPGLLGRVDSLLAFEATSQVVADKFSTAFCPT